MNYRERSSPGTDSGGSVNPAEEFVEVTLDLQDDDTIIVRSVELATFINIDSGNDVVPGNAGIETPTPASTSASRSPTIRRSSSSRLRQLSQDLKAEAVAKAKQFSQDLKSELKRFSWSHGHATRVLNGGAEDGGGGIELALAARAMRRQRAQLDRTSTGAHKALRGLKFINKSKTNDWNEVQNNFNKLAKDGFLYRSDFAKCIGMRDSEEFALELFDALSRRRRIQMEKISIDELYEFWSQITDQSFDSRLQIFFDMVDKNEDGRITEGEVREVKFMEVAQPAAVAKLMGSIEGFGGASGDLMDEAEGPQPEISSSFGVRKGGCLKIGCRFFRVFVLLGFF
ncbi:unnamed protein product [Fraxinus pennsylvanica]|uniref:EF-hand domain-containing protein n=1 Tax=Fraxinus pennsylvanica TaxID=56036 RepID=A0AAD1ZNS0_9LAMI|nr:unnamed protein product [Fraxinus pennsylvanica]